MENKLVLLESVSPELYLTEKFICGSRLSEHVDGDCRASIILHVVSLSLAVCSDLC